MHPDDVVTPPRLKFNRNRSCCLFGASWSHHVSFPFRLTHFYLGLWILTLRTGLASPSSRLSSKEDQ
jgi:hypothetical protein